MAISDRLKELRSETDFNQADVADIVHVTQASMSNYESGASSPDLDTVAELAKFYNVSTDYLLGVTDDRTSQVDRKDYVQLEQGSIPLIKLIGKIKNLDTKDATRLVDLLEVFLNQTKYLKK